MVFFPLYYIQFYIQNYIISIFVFKNSVFPYNILCHMDAMDAYTYQTLYIFVFSVSLPLVHILSTQFYDLLRVYLSLRLK